MSSLFYANCQVHTLWLLLLFLLSWASILLSGGIWHFVKLWINNCRNIPGAQAKLLLRLLQSLMELAGPHSLAVWNILPLSSISPFQHWSCYRSTVGRSPRWRQPLEPRLLHACHLRWVQSSLPLQVRKKNARTIILMVTNSCSCSDWQRESWQVCGIPGEVLTDLQATARSTPSCPKILLFIKLSSGWLSFPKLSKRPKCG